MDSPYQIAGQIPFSPAGGSFGAALTGGLGGAYTSAYNAALQQNSTQYENILKGYQQTAAQQFGNQQNAIQDLGTTFNNTGSGQAAAQQGVQGGYGQLQGNVLGAIQGIDQSQRQAIQDAYRQQAGGLSQQLTNRGLGNTTVSGAMQRGVQLDRTKADIALTNQTQQLNAGYMSQLGLAGLNYAGQAIQANTAQSNLGAMQLQQARQQAQMMDSGQANRQLDFMNSVSMAYPNAQSYMQLLANQGAAQQQQSFAAQHPLGAGVMGAGAGAMAPPISGGGRGQGHIPFSAGMGGGGSVGSMYGGGGSVGGLQQRPYQAPQYQPWGADLAGQQTAGPNYDNSGGGALNITNQGGLAGSALAQGLAPFSSDSLAALYAGFGGTEYGAGEAGGDF